ncbi:ABC transporter ATP-binding protein [Engelhardtia mirabilis]|uniref:Macrolide export ATP-binding/permease protein MacB n=1 Tax=Engelhardtia mirabilis TaxID=2528011 RepID=A0A518BDZ5_9BACT|nr:Macrolide export ATP-binding/permease protein MacB [Planctomycetes bacterium Pla133]QDU99526.1 Macrolide export ATP-binding/permease protein MacB [Planctomycetes bacterium Pla86]
MSASDEPVLALEALERVHGSGEQAVRALGPIDLTVARGEFVAVMGPSGSGKSTLLALAGALDDPTGGRVCVHGHDLARLSARDLAALRRRSIGYVFQDLNLLPGLSALENVALPLELDGVRQRHARAEALATLQRVRIDHLAARFPDDLSGGERQRVAIARAIVGPRTLMLADEPTGALDSVTGERVMRLLRGACDDGRSVVLVTHDASHAAWADRVLHLRDGLWFEPAVADAAARFDGVGS